jgi:fanconi-associated nuclease 1
LGIERRYKKLSNSKKLKNIKIIKIESNIEESLLQPNIIKITSKRTFKKSYGKLYYKGTDGNDIQVEEFALQYYKENQGFDGFHSEGSIFNIIFGLLFWDIIFDSEVPYVFQSKYQMAPLDLHTESFYLSREEKIKKRVNDISEENIKMVEFLDEIWKLNEKCVNAIVNWERYDLEFLKFICVSAGCKLISSICWVFAKNYRNSSKGMPDLILWKVISDEKIEFKFSEVKSENDKLSDYQRIWISNLKSFGSEVELFQIV